MAFESFRAESKAPPRRRRLMVVVSVAFHGSLLAAGIAYSFWHVDELTPPSVKVTFLSAAPPPPPPPPPAGGGGAARKKVALRPKTPLKVPDLVQPREIPKEEPKETKPDPAAGPGEKGGVKGGVIGGTIGGTIGGKIGGQIGGVKGGVIGGTVGGTGPARKSLPEQLGALHKESGEMPRLPPALNHAGASYLVIAQICVTPAGAVESVAISKHADTLLDDAVARAVRGWRYRPLMAGGIAVPFCYPGRFQFTSE